MSKQRNSVLITGASGFIGRHLVEYLKDKYAVYKYNHNYDFENDFIRSVSPAVVVHLAGYYISQHTKDDVTRLIGSNISFGAYIVEEMIRCDCKNLINIGTSFQHYKNKKYSPVNLYAATKQAFQDMLTYYTEAEELKVINLKLFDTYGPEDDRGKLINLLQKARVYKETLYMTEGNQELNMVHVKDVCRAIEISIRRLLRNKVQDQEEWAIGADQIFKLKDVVEAYCHMHEQTPIKMGVAPYRQREVMKTWRKGKRLPGWEPKIKLVDGLKGL